MFASKGIHALCTVDLNSYPPAQIPPLMIYITLQLASWVRAGVSTYIFLVLWMQGTKIQHLTQKLFFDKHLKEYVAITYFKSPVNHKYEKRRELFCIYLHSCASYNPENGGIWKKAHPWCRVLTFSVLTQKQAFKNCHRTGIDLRRQL